MYLYKKELVEYTEFRTKYDFRKHPVSMDSQFNREHHSVLVADYLDSLEDTFRNQAITSSKDNAGGFPEYSEYDIPLISSVSYLSSEEHSSAVLPSFKEAIDRLKSVDFLKSEMCFIQADNQYERFFNSRLVRDLCEKYDIFKTSGIVSEASQVICSPNNIEWMTVVNNRCFKIDMYTGNFEQDSGVKHYDAYNLVGWRPEYRQLTAKEMSMLAVVMAVRYPQEWGITYRSYIQNRRTKKLLGGLQDHYYLRFYLAPYYISQKPKAVEQKPNRDIY